MAPNSSPRPFERTSGGPSLPARPGARRSNALRPEHRVRRRADYLRCYRRGRRRHGDLAVLHVHPNGGAMARLGITASRKVGKAVIRQRTKRRVREIFRNWPERQRLAGLDVVVHLKPTVATADFAALRDELERLLSTLPSTSPAPGP